MTGVTEVGSTFFKQYAFLLVGMFLAGDGVVAHEAAKRKSRVLERGRLNQVLMAW